MKPNIIIMYKHIPLDRKVDDLQFQLLEQGVISGDVLEKTEETSEQQVCTLKKQLEEERKKLKMMEERLEVLVAVCLTLSRP